MAPRPRPPADPEERMLLRARWLRELDDEEREGLADAPLHAVEARFAAWAAGAGVKAVDGGGGEGEHVAA